MFDLSHIPRVTDTLFVTQKEDKYLFLNTALPNWLVLNQNGAFIINLIDKKRSIKDIYGYLEKLKANISTDELLELFISLKKYGIIDDFDLKNQKKLIKKNQNNSSKLHIVHLKLTDECNLSCKYCYAESGGNCKETLTLDKLKDIANQVKEITSHVGYTISGGEPLLNPDTLEYIKFLKELGNDICLLTNGLLINENNAKYLAEYCSMIKISLDGSNDSINGLTRGKNGFDKIMSSYKLLLKYNANVMINMTVTKKNIDDIQNMVETFGSRLSLQPFFKAGRGSGNEDLEITGSEYFYAMANVDGVNPLGAVARSLDTLRGRGVTKCAMADSEISISENGDVFPCQMLTDEEFCGGSIKTQSIKEILNSEVFKNVSSFSSTTNKGCKACPIKLLCGGACRARSYFETGSLFINSDFCEYEKLAYINAILEYTELEEI
jgi:radical SAM protein with 4Fe4S-binding SPASM domain